MSNEDVEQYSDDENVLHEEEVLCCCTRSLNPLFYYKENGKRYDLQPFMYYTDDKYLYISRNVANRYYRYDLQEARRKRMRIPLRNEIGTIVLARADLLDGDNQYLTRRKDVSQELNRLNQSMRHNSRRKIAVITTTIALLSTILIALVLHRN